MTKYIFIENKLKATPYCHANYIKGKDYDIIVRLIILEKERLIYIRINDFSWGYGLENKRAEYQFNENLRACEAYLERNYKKYKIYDSYSINELRENIREDILNS